MDISNHIRDFNHSENARKVTNMVTKYPSLKSECQLDYKRMRTT